jgi:hypothetical protein
MILAAIRRRSIRTAGTGSAKSPFGGHAFAREFGTALS